MRKAVERLIGGSGEATDFAESYRIFLQTDPAVVMAHADLKQELAAVHPS